MDFESLAADLLSQPLDQFTGRRNARIKELKTSGKANLARELSTLKKPSVPLWAVNQVRDRATLDALRRAAQAVAEAQAAAGAGNPSAARDLRAASDHFQGKLDLAGNAAAAALRQGREAVAEDTLRRLREIFRLAAIEGGATWDRLLRGALTVEPRPGDDMIEMFGAGGLPAAGRQAAEAEARRAAKQAEKAALADEALAQRATETAKRLRQEATDAAAAAERAAERAGAAEKEADRAHTQAQASRRATGQKRSQA
jgi:hypothetical protein